MNKKDKRKGPLPLKGIALKKNISGAPQSKKTKKSQQLRSPTIKQSLAASNSINITQQDCEPYPLEEIINLIEHVSPPNTSGIGRQPIFRTNIWPIAPGGSIPTYKPVDIVKALVAFMMSNKPLKECLKTYNVGEISFRTRVLRDYPEARDLFELSRTRKPEAYIDTAQEIIMAEIPDKYYEVTKTGERLSGAAVQHINNQTNFNIKRAQMAERRAFNEKVEVKVDFEIKARAKDIDLAEFANVPLKDLSSML